MKTKNNIKYYILNKDIPGCKAGTHFYERNYDDAGIYFVPEHVSGIISFLPKEMENKEWFTPVLNNKFIKDFKQSFINYGLSIGKSKDDVLTSLGIFLNEDKDDVILQRYKLLKLDFPNIITNNFALEYENKEDNFYIVVKTIGIIGIKEKYPQFDYDGNIFKCINYPGTYLDMNHKTFYDFLITTNREYEK